METVMRKMSIEIKVCLFLIAVSLFLLIISPGKIMLELKETWENNLKILLLSLIAVVISAGIHFLITPAFVERHLSGNRLRHLFYATLFGIITPGPVYAIYPIVFVLRKKGIGYPLLVSFITGQTIIGPARIPLEIGIFGTKFFLYRLGLSFIMGPAAGILYILLSKIIPDKQLTDRH